MRRTISIFVCLCAVSLSVMAEEITHDFHTDSGKTLAFTGTKIGTYSDGIVYTCNGSAEFGVRSLGNPICVIIPQNDSVIISPAITGLTEMRITTYYTPTVTLGVKVSTDSINWVDQGTYSATTSSQAVVTLSKGNYYVSIKNVTSPSSVAYVRRMYYLYDPVEDTCDNCFPVVFE